MISIYTIQKIKKHLNDEMVRKNIVVIGNTMEENNLVMAKYMKDLAEWTLHCTHHWSNPEFL